LAQNCDFLLRNEANAMKAILLRKSGGPGVLVAEEVPDPIPGMAAGGRGRGGDQLQGRPDPLRQTAEEEGLE